MNSFDFSQASLRSSERGEAYIITRSISTLHRGKGVFEWTPSAVTPLPYLEIEADGRILKVPVVLRNPSTETSDVIFDITNANRVLGNSESLELWIFTNERVNPMTPYFVQIKSKDQLLYQEQVILNPRSERFLTIPASSFALVNGGVLTLSLYRASNSFVTLNSATNNANDISRWLIPQGEQLFFKKPSSSLKVDISTNQQTYGEGSTVSYSITVSDAETGRRVTTDTYVSLVATDENVFFGESANSR
jgi:hypothetical protein